MSPRLDHLELARRLIPPEGNNFGLIAQDKTAESEFLARVRPLVHRNYETVWRHSPEGSKSHAGLDATLAALRAIGRLFETFVAFPELYVDLGDSVLVLVRREGHTVDGVDFAEEGAVIYSFEGGLLRRMQMYADRELALADANISAAEARERGVPP